MPRAMRPPIRPVAMLPPPTKAIRLVMLCVLLPPRSARAASENGGADAHDGRAFEHGGFEVVTHAHRQGVEGVAGRVE